MSLKTIETNDGLQNKNLLVNPMTLLTADLGPVDRYDEYLSRGKQVKESSSNPRNLFDDSNREDRNWLKIAKEFLKRSSANL